MFRFASVHIVAAAAIAAATGTAAQATGTAVDSIIVSGFAQHYPGPFGACATSGPQAMEQKYFSGASVQLPDEGYAYCGLAGSIQDTSSASGVSTETQSVHNYYGNGFHDQSVTATADFGVLKAASSGSYAGNAISGFAHNAGDAAAYSTDTLPVPIGAATVQFGVTIDGTASVTGSSQILTILDYQIDGGLIYGAFHASLFDGSASVSGLNGTDTGDVAGFVVAPGSIAGGGVVTSYVSAVSGPTFDLTLALLAVAYPTQGGGSATDDFGETARLSSLSFFDAGGNAIAFGTIAGASGRLYDAEGVHTAPTAGVPEPAAWALLLVGFAAVGGTQRRMRRRAT